MVLQEAHVVASHLEQAILKNNPLGARVTTDLEAPAEKIVRRKDVTQHYREMAEHIVELADKVAGKGSAHDVHLYQPATTQLELTNGASNHQEELDLVLHTIFDPHIPLSQPHIQAEPTKRPLPPEPPNLRPQ